MPRALSPARLPAALIGVTMPLMPVPILVSGSIAIDRIMNFEGRYVDKISAAKLDVLSISIFLESLKDCDGGNGATIAYTLALLGEEPVLIGSVGKDGLLYMEKLAHLGVDISHVHESKLATASFNVITDSDQNQVGGFYPGAMADSDSLTFRPWKDANPIAVVSAHYPSAMRRLVAECKEFGIRLCYDIGQQVTNLPVEDMRAGLEAATVLLMNEYELSVFSEKIGLSVDEIKAKVPVLITTLGKNGSVIEGTAVPEAIKVGIAKPKQAGDPTGAGDTYRGGFLYGYARDWPLKACAQLGAVCASYAVETMESQAHTFTMEEVAKRYREAFNEELPIEVIEEETPIWQTTKLQISS